MTTRNSLSVARPIMTIALALCAGACAYHSYGLTVTPARNYASAAEHYLLQRGFVVAPPAPGDRDQLTMERQRGDSVDHVRLFRGG
ncbi:MAG TPA: hypothetical protein VGI83_06755, partial [Gemmatimonadales bacterium]